MDLALRQRVFWAFVTRAMLLGGGFDKVIGTGNLRGKEYGV